jgi:hypothetical protein
MDRVFGSDRSGDSYAPRDSDLIKFLFGATLVERRGAAQQLYDRPGISRAQFKAYPGARGDARDAKGHRRHVPNRDRRRSSCEVEDYSVGFFGERRLQ